MKLKNIFPIVLCILIGFFMGTFLLNQYNTKTDTVALTGENLYFIGAGVFSSEEQMKEEMKKTYSYIGITKNKKNLKKLQDFYTSAGYDIYVREIFVSDLSFLTVLEQYDLLLNETTDNNVIKSIENQVINKYEELILNDKD